MKDLAYRNFPQLAISEGDTTPNPGFPAIAHSTTLNLLMEWNGTRWTLFDENLEFIVDWIIPPELAQWVFNTGAMTLDFSTSLTSNAGSPTAGETVWLSSYSDATKLGLYVLGSVASLSAVPITRHTDWPGDRYVKKGTIFKAKKVSRIVGSYGTAITTTAYPSTDVVDLSDSIIGYGAGPQTVARFSSTGTVPGGITAGQWYWVKRTNDTQVALYSDNTFSSIIDITSAGTGTITMDVAPTAVDFGVWAYFEWPSSDQKLNSGTSFNIGTAKFDIPIGNQTGINCIAIGSSGASGNSSIIIGNSGIAFSDNTLVFGGGYAYGADSICIGNYTSTEGVYTVSIGSSSKALSDNVVSIAHGYNYITSDLSRELLMEGFWHFEVTTTNNTETTCYVNKLATTLSGVSIRSGYYFLEGKAVAHSNDRTKFAVWSVRGTVQRDGYSSDPVASFEFIPENNTGGSEELALKIIPFVIASPTKQLAFKVTGASGTTYHWSIDLQYSCKDSYDYDAQTLDLAGAKNTRLNYIILPTSESITAGAPVNIWNDSGTTKVRNANASNGRQADGFVAMTYGTGDSVVVFLSGNTSILSGLTIGPVYLGTTAGTYTSSAPGTGNLVQRLGFATTTSNIAFIREMAIQT